MISILFVNFKCADNVEYVNNKKHGPFSYYIIDKTINYPEAQFIASVYSNNKYLSEISVDIPEKLTDGNSLILQGFMPDTSYFITIWIDKNGDNNFGDDMFGAIINLLLINDNILNEVEFFNFNDYKIFVQGDGDKLNGKKVYCYWFITGFLKNELINNLFDGNIDFKYIMGSTSTILPESIYTYSITNIADNDLPVPTFVNSGTEYDLYCFCDLNNNKIRDYGDWEGLIVNLPTIIADDQSILMNLKKYTE